MHKNKKRFKWQKFQDKGSPIICLFCKESVLDTYLELHIRNDHKIGHDVAVRQLLDMHYPERNMADQKSLEIQKNADLSKKKEENMEILRPPDPDRYVES